VSKPSKILMTADTVGGVWSYSIELARALQTRGVNVALATMGAPLSKAQSQEAAGLPNLEVFESRYKLEWMQDPWAEVTRAGEWLLELEASTVPDVIHLNGYVHAALNWRRPVLSVGHSCVLSWWDAVRGQAAPPEWREYQRRVEQGLNAADYIAAPSKAMLTALYKHYGPMTAGCVIPNGRDASRYRPGKKEAFILTAGRLWDEAKNIRLLETVAGTLPWPVYIAGDNQHPEGGVVDIDEAHLLGRLSQPQLASWMARASIFVMPARYEPFGLSILEAALSGCALVLGDIASLRELWDGAALFINPDDPSALKAALAELIENETLRKQLAAKAYERAQSFSPERMLDGYLEIYEQLMRAGRKQPVAV
jgi:glycosyltransferase involved in cell wall biosynthesis